MIYEVTDNRISIDGYFFEMDTNNTIHIYAKGLKSIGLMRVGKPLSFNVFKKTCKKWLEENI